MSEILYLKIDRNHQVDHVDVRLGDVAKLECTDLNKKNRLKTLKLLKIQAEKRTDSCCCIRKSDIIEEIR